jgi:DNA-binding MarR family transcriptional regulator
MDQITNDEMLAILASTLRVLQEEIHPEVSVARLAALVAVMRNPGMSQTDLRNDVHLSQQGASRAVLALQGKGTSSEPYPVLLNSTPDPSFSRRNLLTPTPKAGQLLHTIADNVNRVLTSRRAVSAT